MRMLLVFVAAFVSTVIVAHAQDYKLGTLQIEHPWSRATPKGATVAAGYLTIRNTGDAPDRLIGGSLAIAQRLEIHEMTSEAGVMKMREIKGGLEIKPGETVELKPGSHHLMFVGLKQPVAQGNRLKGTLTFEKAGTIEVDFVAQPIGAQTGQHDGHPPSHR